MINVGKLQDLTGQRFNRLTVLKRGEKRKDRKTYWWCECNCGNIKLIYSYDLISEKVKSCGCLRDEKAKNLGISAKKYNTYNLSSGYGIGYTSKGEEFYFDIEDYDLIKDYCWFKDKKDGYIVAKDKKCGHILLHRLIMNYPNYMIDHRDGVENNCRKNNLRLCNSSKNQMNRKLGINNTSGVSGVSWNKKDNKWIARISVNNNKLYLGRFYNFEDAVKVRKDAEEKYYGEWSYDNSRKNEN